MKNKIRPLQLTLICAVTFFFMYNINSVSISYTGDIIVIGNKDVPVSSLSTEEIRSIFLGEKVKWDNTRKITFAILKTTAHEDFLSKYIGSTDSQYHNYWRKMVFTGKSRSPISFKTAAELLEYVAKTSGAIGYIPSEAYNNKVKIISLKKEPNE